MSAAEPAARRGPRGGRCRPGLAPGHGPAAPGGPLAHTHSCQTPLSSPGPVASCSSWPCGLWTQLSDSLRPPPAGSSESLHSVRKCSKPRTRTRLQPKLQVLRGADVAWVGLGAPKHLDLGESVQVNKGGMSVRDGCTTGSAHITREPFTLGSPRSLWAVLVAVQGYLTPACQRPSTLPRPLLCPPHPPTPAAFLQPSQPFAVPSVPSSASWLVPGPSALPKVPGLRDAPPPPGAGSDPPLHALPPAGQLTWWSPGPPDATLVFLAEDTSDPQFNQSQFRPFLVAVAPPPAPRSRVAVCCAPHLPLSLSPCWAQHLAPQSSPPRYESPGLWEAISRSPAHPPESRTQP